MGKNKTRPTGYKPALEFYLRRQAEGGKLLSPATFHGQADALTRRQCLVLVHGFNNTDSEAAEAYAGFRTREAEIFSVTDPVSFEKMFGDTYWPGDADWSFFDKLDFLVYPTAVHTAVSAARELTALLQKMPNLERVDFIAHSLGCRVALETLLLLRKRTLPLIGRVVLMAAAVPSEMLERGGRFFDLLMELWAEGIPIRVLHSKSDTVLHFAFPPGQSLAGGKEASERALGRFGPSVMMPGYHTVLTEREITGAAHGDYWGHSKSAPSRVATDEAGHFLNIGAAPRPISSERDLVGSSAPQVTRDVGQSRPAAPPR
ncbi:MAG: alpha/beta hydrolase [Gemmatimonadaceae bacterium]